MDRRRMESMATLLDRPKVFDHLDDLVELQQGLLNAGSKPRIIGMIKRGVPVMAGGQYYVDTRPPFNTAALPSVTLATTAKQLWPTVTMSPTQQSDWFIGKEFRLRAQGTITTAATPGNLTVSIAYGTADNTGIIVSSAAQTLVANQTTLMWQVDAYLECRGVGTSGGSPGGSMYAWGTAQFGTAVIAVGSFFIPASAPAAVNADTTVSSGMNIQFARSGSTAETAVVQDAIFQAIN